MKSFDVTLEARVTLIAYDEWDAIQKATSICGGSVLLMPMYVTEGYVRVWEPKKAVAQVKSEPAKIDDEVPF